MTAYCRYQERLIVAALALALGIPAAWGQASGSTQGGGSQKAGGPTNPDSVHDVITISFSSHRENLEDLIDDNKVHRGSEVLDAIGKIENLQQVPWPSGKPSTGLEILVYTWLSTEPANSACGLYDVSQIYIFHIEHWAFEKAKDDGQARVLSSGWYAYKLTKKGKLESSGFTGTGDQLIYGKTKALITGISVFDVLPDVAALDNFTEQYQTNVIQGTPENAQDLGQLIAGLGGVTGAKASALREGKPAPVPIFVSVGCQPGTTKLPFTLTVTDSIKTKPDDQGKAKTDSGAGTPTAGTLSCSTNGNRTPCATTHSFVSLDKEWWDVSIGITTPGTRETKYAFSNGAVQTSVTRHTDLYGMFDFFPAGEWLPKDAYFPHINIGLPVTSQSFYRPYFGLSENLTGWTRLQKKLSLPVGLNFFAGVVYMKTKLLTDNPTTQAQFNADLITTRVWKGVFGIEVPISSIASKLGGKGGGSGSGKGGSGK
jgi:hypothetical protein